MKIQFNQDLFVINSNTLSEEEAQKVLNLGEDGQCGALNIREEVQRLLNEGVFDAVRIRRNKNGTLCASLRSKIEGSFSICEGKKQTSVKVKKTEEEKKAELLKELGL